MADAPYSVRGSIHPKITVPVVTDKKTAIRPLLHDIPIVQRNRRDNDKLISIMIIRIDAFHSLSQHAVCCGLPDIIDMAVHTA